MQIKNTYNLSLALQGCQDWLAVVDKAARGVKVRL